MNHGNSYSLRNWKVNPKSVEMLVIFNRCILIYLDLGLVQDLRELEQDLETQTNYKTLSRESLRRRP